MASGFKHIVLLILCIGIYTSTQAQNQEKPLTRILFIYDASNSMNGFWKTKQKHQVARELLSEMLDSLESIPNLQVAIRAFGHQKPFPPQDCDDTRLEVPFSNDNYDEMRAALQKIRPSGTTPIALTLEASGDDFTPCDNCRNIIILITDGVEECDGDPCAVSYVLQKNGIILKPFVLGINIDDRFKNTYDCVGNFYDAGSEEEFRQVLGIVVSQALNNTTMQVNLLDVNTKPTETNVAMTFLNHYTGKIMYNYIHSMNARGVPDTIPVDPAITYDLIVHTVPPVRKDSFALEPGKHNVLAVDAPQGDLNFPLGNNSLLQEKNIVVRKSGSCEYLNEQSFGSSSRYLVGTYDLEINTLPRTYVKEVRVSQSHTTDIEIPEPGVAHINMDALGYGTILKENKGKLEWVTTLATDITKTSVYLQPGNYRFVFRTRKSTDTVFTIEKKFKITTGLSTTVNIY